MVPLCYIMMTRRRKADYVAVFNRLQELFGRFDVEEFMSDFEPAVWSAVSECFPDVRHIGCTFHWSQAIIKTVRRLHLTKIRGDDKRMVYRLLRLPYLRRHDIGPLFQQLWDSASDQLSLLFDYVNRIWINGRWTPKAWCMYQRQFRTNNHQEGNHVKLNQDVGPSVSKENHY